MPNSGCFGLFLSRSLGSANVLVRACLRSLLFLTLCLQLSKLLGQLLCFSLIVRCFLFGVGDPLLQLGDLLWEGLVDIL